MPWGMPGDGRILIGVLAAGDDRDLADSLPEHLPDDLKERIGGHSSWQVEVCEAEPADSTAGRPDLTAAVRRRLLERGWQLGFQATAQRGADGRRLCAPGMVRRVRRHRWRRARFPGRER